MKFGQYFEQHLFPPWRNEYIQYDHMKRFLKEQQLTKGWTQQDETYFTDTLLVTELEKVNAFIHLKIKQIRSIMHHKSKQDTSQKANDLMEYIELNASGFQKILKKHDKWTGTSLQYCARFRDIQPKFEDLIQQLNQIINSYRLDASLSAINEKKVKIKTTKYWIHSDNLTEVQAILLFHLPPVQSFISNVSEKNMMNTIYFDSPTQFNLYSELLKRNESAETIQARW
jgi:SPX domain protein involved in polyphosphate accumulation